MSKALVFDLLDGDPVAIDPAKVGNVFADRGKVTIVMAGGPGGIRLHRKHTFDAVLHALGWTPVHVGGAGLGHE